MNNLFDFQIMTPDDTIFKDRVRMVVAPAVTGDVGILKDHMPLIAQLKSGIVKIEQADHQFNNIEIGEGLMHVDQEKVTIFLGE